ncbi:microsomal dipeptidase-like Zn-dependent dipeptidase [Sphingomonas zeicaulis]|uniref:dipeptidase n=1 Tax=Sphingomonas zeicaulis TaxID=1632740 RepID=UPI003D1F0A4B
MRMNLCRALLLTAALLAPLSVPAMAQSLVFDPHVDLPASAAAPEWSGGSDPASQFDVDRARRGGLTAIGLALFVPQGERTPAALVEARWGLLARHDAIVAIAKADPGRVERAATPADVRRIVATGKLALVETLLNAWPLGEDLDEIDRWHARGVSIFGFVHAGNNQFADSSRPALPRGERPDENGGLSPLGRSAVKRLNDLGVLIDASQLSDKAFDQLLSASRAPVIASHSDVRALVDVSRNLSDAQLDALKAKGGVIAINAFSAYLRPDAPATRDAIAALQREFGASPGGNPALSGAQQAEYTRRYYAIRAKEPKATLAELANAIDYAVKRIGVDHVAISSDFNHGGGVAGWADVGETANVTAELRRRGYDDAAIAKLWGGNLLRAWQAAIDARDPAYRAAH